MINILLIIIETIISYLFILVLYKKYKTDGIFVFGVLATIVSMILGIKQIDILTIPIPIGLGITTSMVIAANIITQKSGPKETKTYINLILITIFVSALVFYLTGKMSESTINYYSNVSYTNIFTKNIKSYIALILSMIVSIYLTTRIYFDIKRIKNKIIYSNILSVLIVNLLENIIYIGILYINQFKLVDIIICIIIRYLIKIIIGIFGTIPIYIADRYN